MFRQNACDFENQLNPVDIDPESEVYNARQKYFLQTCSCFIVVALFWGFGFYVGYMKNNGSSGSYSY